MTDDAEDDTVIVRGVGEAGQWNSHDRRMAAGCIVSRVPESNMKIPGRSGARLRA